MVNIDLQRRLSALVEGVTEAGKTRRIVVGDDALQRLISDHEDRSGPGAPSTALLIGDAHTFTACGDDLAKRFKGTGFNVETWILEEAPEDDHLVCDTRIIAHVRERLSARPGLEPIAVGAGTINDIVKKASAELERPYVVVPTAASMNGYTSSIAAVLADGVKRTVAAQQPRAIYVPLQVIAAAPALLNRAGFGDLLSKPFSDADWLLSHYLRDVPYDPAPAALLEDAYLALLDHAEDVSTGEAEGIRLLTETLLLSGFSMAMAGTSAPASGGEHLVSHYWDMEQHCQSASLQGLHGTQVGVATRLSAMLYERLVRLTADDFDGAAAAARQADDSWLDGLAGEHPRLTPEVAQEVTAQLRIKQRFGADLSAELQRAKDVWPELVTKLRTRALSAERITDALRRAGCVDRASGIGVGRERLVHTLRVCRHIRSRYVALDLMDDLGLLHGWADDVAGLSESESEDI